MPVWNRNGCSSRTRNWLKLKPVGPTSGMWVERRKMSGAISSMVVSTGTAFRRGPPPPACGASPQHPPLAASPCVGRPPRWDTPIPGSAAGGPAAGPRTDSAAASARLRTPSLDSTRPTWCSTVLGEMNSVSAIWALVRPRATAPSTSRSRGVSEPTAASASRGRDRPVSPHDREQRVGPVAGGRAPSRSNAASAARASATAAGGRPGGERSARARRTGPSASGRLARPGGPWPGEGGPGAGRVTVGPATRPSATAASARTDRRSTRCPARPGRAGARRGGVARADLDLDEQRRAAAPSAPRRPPSRTRPRATAAARSRSPRRGGPGPAARTAGDPVLERAEQVGRLVDPALVEAQAGEVATASGRWATLGRRRGRAPRAARLGLGPPAGGAQHRAVGHPAVDVHRPGPAAHPVGEGGGDAGPLLGPRTSPARSQAVSIEQ